MHEFSHGFVAKLFGDKTAEKEGRLSLNPMNHLDPFGSVLAPALLYLMKAPILFAWARPVPIDPRQFKSYRPGVFFVAFAGPFMNLFLAYISALFLHFNPNAATLGNELLKMMIGMNCALAAFNLLPLPPLDGSKMLGALLPARAAYYYNKLEPYGTFIILFFILLPKISNVPSVLHMVLLPLINFFLEGICFLSGQ